MRSSTHAQRAPCPFFPPGALRLGPHARTWRMLVPPSRPAAGHAPRRERAHSPAPVRSVFSSPRQRRSTTMSLSRRDLLSAVQRGVTLHELLAPRGLEVLAWFCVPPTSRPPTRSERPRW